MKVSFAIQYCARINFIAFPMSYLVEKGFSAVGFLLKVQKQTKYLWTWRSMTSFEWIPAWCRETDLSSPSTTISLSMKLPSHLTITWLTLWESAYDIFVLQFRSKKTAVFGCLTNTIAPPPIVLESCSRAQTDRPV